MSEKQIQPVELKNSDPALVATIMRKMIRFAATHGEDITTADLTASNSSDSRLVHQYAPPTYNADGTKNHPTRFDGKSTWFYIEPSQRVNDRVGGSIEVLSEGPAMRYGKLAELYLVDSEGDHEDYYLFKTDGTVSGYELQVTYDEEGEEQLTRSESHQVDDDKLREVSRMLDYIHPDHEVYALPS